MGFTAPYFESDLQTLGTPIAITGPSAVVQTIDQDLYMGKPSLESSIAWSGVIFNFKVAIASGSVDTGLKINFYQVFDDATVDTSVMFAEFPITAASIGHAVTSKYFSLIKKIADCGWRLRLTVVTDTAGDSALTVTTRFRRWNELDSGR